MTKHTKVDTPQLVAHLHDVIDAWFDINGEHITDQSIKDLKETLHLTTKAYYE